MTLEPAGQQLAHTTPQGLICRPTRVIGRPHVNAAADSGCTAPRPPSRQLQRSPLHKPAQKCDESSATARDAWSSAPAAVGDMPVIGIISRRLDWCHRALHPHQFPCGTDVQVHTSLSVTQMWLVGRAAHRRALRFLDNNHLQLPEWQRAQAVSPSPTRRTTLVQATAPST